MPFYSSLSSKCLFRTACATNWTVRAPVQQPCRIAQVSIQGPVPQSTKPFSKKSSLGLVHLLTNQSPLFAALYTVRRRKNLNSNEYSLIYRHIFCHIEGTGQQLKNVPSLNLTVLVRQDSIILYCNARNPSHYLIDTFLVRHYRCYISDGTPCFMKSVDTLQTGCRYAFFNI